jgi:uncharacterized phage protein (TIGR02218 family)
MMYLNRPVFEIAANWVTLPLKAFRYEMSELAVGFGKRWNIAVADHAVQGWEISVDLLNEAEVAACESFFADLKGRLKGFWFPAQFMAAKITNGVSATQFDIEKIDLLSTFASHPDQYLYFEKAGQTAQIAKINAVADIGGGKERITVDAALAPAIDATWRVWRLHYVRLADDEESFEWIAERRQRRKIRVIELPKEYGAFELGTEPVFLYHFWLETPTPIHWRFTSFDQQITSSGEVYTPKAITHSAQRFSARSDREDLTIEAVYEPNHPLALFIPLPLGKSMNVEVIETTLGNLNAQTKRFTGRVLEAPLNGHMFKAQCSSLIDVLGARVMGMVLEPRCNYVLFDKHCKLNKADFDVACTITRISGNAIRVTGAGLAGKSENWFALGWLETGDGATFETRSVLYSGKANGNNVQLILDAPLARAILNQALTLFPGCDGSSETCTAKYNNFINWGGHFIPDRNPAIQGIPLPNGGANKK